MTTSFDTDRAQALIYRALKRIAKQVAVPVGAVGASEYSVVLFAVVASVAVEMAAYGQAMYEPGGTDKIADVLAADFRRMLKEGFAELEKHERKEPRQ